MTHGPIRQRVEQYIANIEHHNRQCNAIWTPTFEQARHDADIADTASPAAASDAPLHGMVVALKDNINTQGVRTTSGSKLFENYVPDEDAHVWQRMRQAGAILIGKAGLHECVFGANSQNEWFGRIRNPWSLAHIPGGSSGGSGAAVAADFCDIALGTDTGGSVRIPAALCGIAGLRPTMGAVSNRGVRPISPHLDTVGPMARRVTDVAKAFAVMKHYDPLDDTAIPAPMPPGEAVLQPEQGGIGRLTIGLPGGFFREHLHPATETAFANAIDIFRDLDANIVPVNMDDAERAANITARIIVADAAAYYQEYIDKQPNAFSRQVMRRMSIGFEVTGIEYAGHMRFMRAWQREVERRFDDVDLILTPTLRAPAALISDADDLIKVTQTITPFPMAWALSGVPNLALPCGFSDEGLPVSCQLAAARWHEEKLFSAGRAFQSVTDFHEQRATAAANA